MHTTETQQTLRSTGLARIFRPRNLFLAKPPTICKSARFLHFYFKEIPRICQNEIEHERETQTALLTPTPVRKTPPQEHQGNLELVGLRMLFNATYLKLMSQGIPTRAMPPLRPQINRLPTHIFIMFFIIQSKKQIGPRSRKTGRDATEKDSPRGDKNEQPLRMIFLKETNRPPELIAAIWKLLEEMLV